MMRQTFRKFLKFYVLVFVCIENYALVHAIYYYYNNAVQKLLLLYKIGGSGDNITSTCHIKPSQQHGRESLTPTIPLLAKDYDLRIKKIQSEQIRKSRENIFYGNYPFIVQLNNSHSPILQR
ncbi:hypothetical protein GQX74_001335 [Glossina fuscipes]|nr:hypothetical protein GQX74_001335 [Glossina fuscipes]